MELDWLPKGADINPIENVWEIIKKQIAHQTFHSASADYLWEAVLREWEHLKSTTIADALYTSMQRRMSEVVSALGEFARH